MSDETLLEAWRAGDTQAGRALYERHAGAVARFFENKVRTNTADLVQQTFVGLLESHDRIRDPTKLRAYLLGIAFRVFRAHLRKQARGREVDLDAETSATHDPGPSTVAAHRREQRLLLEALRRLPIRHQTVLELHYWEELNAAEIAKIVGVSHSAVRTRLSTARTVLADEMAKIERSRELIESTTAGLDRWARELREKT